MLSDKDGPQLYEKNVIADLADLPKKLHTTAGCKVQRKTMDNVLNFDLSGTWVHQQTSQIEKQDCAL